MDRLDRILVIFLFALLVRWEFFSQPPESYGEPVLAVAVFCFGLFRPELKAWFTKRSKNRFEAEINMLPTARNLALFQYDWNQVFPQQTTVAPSPEWLKADREIWGWYYPVVSFIRALGITSQPK